VKLQPGDGLLDALAVVGGLGPKADAVHATLVRRGQAHPQSLNIEALLKGDLSQNVPLSDGDIIQIPKKEISTYQVVGEVKIPGARAMDGTTKVLDAILSTGGLTDRADRSRITLTRKNQAQPIVIDLDQVLAGETSANVLVQPGDVLTVAPRMVVQVVGEVRAPSERLIRNGGTVMEAIMFAGGFGPDADRASVQITHKNGATEKCSLADITTVVGGPVLRPGDLVVVNHSSPETITLIGAVRAPGPMKFQIGMKITDALMAAGLLENSQWKAIRVIRGEDGPGRKILMFDLESYLKAPKTMNLALQAGDRIFVEAQKRGGTSFFRTLLQMAPLASIFFPLFGI
jgi:protein involved in polysaccharide export with SLBB domain